MSNTKSQSKRGVRCPHCNQRGLSISAKLSLGPLGSKPCLSCKRLLGVAWLPYVAIALLSSLLPFAGALLAISLFGSLPLWSFVAVVVIGAVMASVPALWLHYWLVPLVAGPN